MNARRPKAAIAALAALAATAALAGCGGSSNATLSVPKVAPARIFTLAGFQPSTRVSPGRPTTVSFTVQLPSGKPLTSYRTGAGPQRACT